MCPRAPLIFTLLVLVATLCPGLAGQVETGEPAEDPRALARSYLEGNDDAGRALQAIGPSVLLEVRPLFDGEAARPRLLELVSAIVRDAVERSLKEEATLRYHGQFAHLAPLGREGEEVLLEIFLDEDAPFERRNRVATALGDIGTARLLPRLKAVAEDFLTEVWLEREAGFLMARLGDRSLVDLWLSRNRKIAGQPPSTSNLPEILGAHTELAEIYYRIGDYEGALRHYRRKKVLLEDLRERVRPELKEAVNDEIALLHYNLACSLSLAGRIDEALAALDRSLGHREVTIGMVEADGDLRAVRKDPRYKAWIAGKKAAQEDPAPKASGGE
ncbi:MAG: hypothetical protein ACE5GW_01390 [Planctomycetota bacterium]